MGGQGASGADHVGDHVGHAQLDGDLHRSLEADDLGRDPPGGQVVGHQARVGRGDAPSGQALDRPPVGGCGRRRAGVEEAGAPDAEGQELAHHGPRVEGQVPPGDAQVDLAPAHVDGDVAGPEEVEAHAVGRVDDGEATPVGAAPVAGLGEHGGDALGEGPLVGQGDGEHRVLRVGRRRVGARESGRPARDPTPIRDVRAWRRHEVRSRGARSRGPRGTSWHLDRPISRPGRDEPRTAYRCR